MQWLQYSHGLLGTSSPRPAQLKRPQNEGGISSDSLRESRLPAAYPGRHIIQPARTSSVDRVIGVWHHFAPRDGYTKFDNGVGSNPLDFFFGVGSSSARAADFSIFSVVRCTPQEI